MLPKPLCQNVGKNSRQSPLNSLSPKAGYLTLYRYIIKIGFGIKVMEKLDPKWTKAVWEFSLSAWFQWKFLESHCRESGNVGLGSGLLGGSHGSDQRLVCVLGSAFYCEVIKI